MQDTIQAANLLCSKLQSPTTTTPGERELSDINGSEHTQPEARLCKKGLQHCLACSIILYLREILGNASAEVQGQAQALTFWREVLSVTEHQNCGWSK